MFFEEIIINQFLQSFMNPIFDILFQLITYFGHPLSWFIFAAWLFWAGQEKKSFTLMTILLFSSLTSGMLKQIVARPRPTGLVALDNLKGYSFPSGHSTLAGTIAGYFYYTKKNWTDNKIISKIVSMKKIGYLSIILAILTGISRLYLGVHFLTDVLMGLLLGTILGLIITKIESRIDQANFHITKIREELIIVIIFTLLLALDLIIPEEYYGAYAIMGYFVGYTLFKHTKLEKNLNLTQSKKQLVVNFIFGTIFLGILGASAYYFTTGLISQILFFSSGIFITLIWPIAISFIAKRIKVQKKAKKFKN